MDHPSPLFSSLYLPANVTFWRDGRVGQGQDGYERLLPGFGMAAGDAARA